MRNVKTSAPVAAGPMLAAATSREAAFQTLESVRLHGSRIAEAWNQVINAAALSPLERNLSRELAFGVLRREITLNVLLQKFVRRPIAEIEPPLKTILQLGLYQLLFACQIPPHAAVHETVELAKKAGRLRWAGFVNGVLRAAERICTEQFVTEASSRALPVGSRRYRLLAEPVFPDPTADFLGYFWRAYGYPEWLASRWVKRWPAETLHRLGDWQRSPPPVFVRVNRLRIGRDELLDRFQQAGLDAAATAPAKMNLGDVGFAESSRRTKSTNDMRFASQSLGKPYFEVRRDLDVAAEELPEAIRVSSGGRIESWPGYEEGLFSVQDLSAMLAARRLAPTPGSRVLDLCAAPGGKTCHLAELMGDNGEVLATDITPSRLSRIVENAQRLRLSSIHALLVAEDGHDLPRGPFDFILADVPCSNTGVIGRRPEVIRNLTQESIQELSRLQAELLQRSADRLKPGGRLLYSTCSIESEEDEAVIEAFLAQRSDFRRIESELLLPGNPADGGYQALLERIAPSH